jgi:hypothetical protein
VDSHLQDLDINSNIVWLWYLDTKARAKEAYARFFCVVEKFGGEDTVWNECITIFWIG